MNNVDPYRSSNEVERERPISKGDMVRIVPNPSFTWGWLVEGKEGLVLKAGENSLIVRVFDSTRPPYPERLCYDGSRLYGAKVYIHRDEAVRLGKATLLQKLRAWLC